MIPPIKSWHFEITSKCALRCSRCQRTLSPEIYSPRHLSLQVVESLLNSKTFSGCEKILFCGVLGDPIYHDRFHDVIRLVKAKDIKAKIVTNGSGRSIEWWKELLSILTPKDLLQFSIDGLEDTNHLYRVGSQWESIFAALKLAAASPVKTRWKYIVFKHNQHQIEKVKSLAQEWGINQFQFVKSNRFGAAFGYQGKEDPLQPDDEFLSERLGAGASGNGGTKTMKLKCSTGEEHFISYDGFYSPCCWTGFKTTYQNPFYDRREIFDVKTRSIDEVLSSPEVIKLIKEQADLQTASDVCRRYCSFAEHETTRSHTISSKVERW
jgi:MoaA/NifB/PqqE/SkfB family radical SAM enzyme